MVNSSWELAHTSTKRENPNQESEKYLNASLQSLHNNISFLHFIPRKAQKKGSRAGANCNDSGSLNQEIAVSAPFSR